MKIELELKENRLHIHNEDVDDFDFVYDFVVYGDDELLYGLKNDTISKGMGRWHRPTKDLFSYKDIKFKMSNLKKLENISSEIDPLNEEIWEDNCVNMNDIEQVWDITELRKEYI
jgi:hypothetical protein